MRRPLLTAAILLAAAAASASAQDVETRAEGLRRAREQKATDLHPPQAGRIERALLALESGRLFERILNPAEGFYPKLGTVTPGGGFSAGPAYRRPGLLGGHADFSAFAAGSLKQYWMIDARLALPRLADGRLSADLHAQTYDFTQEDFFGLGPDSRRERHSKYGIRNTIVDAQARAHLTPWLSVGGGLAHLAPVVGNGDSDRPILAHFRIAELPGMASQPDYLRYDAVLDVDYREPRGNARGGGRYLLTYQHYDDREGSRHGFRRLDADLQQFISLLRNRRVLALRAFASTSDGIDGGSIPFYLQPTLGGPDDLRGFRRYRFRDQHLLLLQAEYRWEIFTAVDGAIFYDAGKVASRAADLSLRDLETDYGIGFRFGTINGIFFRVEAAFGSSDGKHLVLRFGNVF